MKARSIRLHILIPYVLLILILSISVFGLGTFLIRTGIVKRQQEQVTRNLATVRYLLQKEIEELEKTLNVGSTLDDLRRIRELLDVDYAYTIKKDEISESSPHAWIAAKEGQAMGALRIVSFDELVAMGNKAIEKTLMPVKNGPYAYPSDRKELSEAMVMENAKPLYGKDGKVDEILVAGKILNRDFDFVDNIRDLVFTNAMYEGKPYGTVTIFQDDIRIATNVLDSRDERAIGTRVSREVYEKVLQEGKTWTDRAFVVTDWYITAYEPLKNSDGEIIGILYVGVLEKPFIDLQWQLLAIFIALIGIVAAAAVFFAFMIASRIARPVQRIINASQKIEQGDLEFRVNAETPVYEINVLGRAFNTMAEKLQEREKSLKDTNQRLEEMNQNYLDLIGYVSHELKGAIGSTLMSAHTVKDGFLGAVNDAQKKSLEMVTRNLEYLTATVRSFLNLGMIERGELIIDRSVFLLKEDVFDQAVAIHSQNANKKEVVINNMLSPGQKLYADPDLLRIVANNLIGNAVKYAKEKGTVILRAKNIDNHSLEIEVYNDSIPLSEKDEQLLFKKFSRVVHKQQKREKGTGLGLYISREIVEKHLGKIWHESRLNGNSFFVRLKLNIE